MLNARKLIESLATAEPQLIVAGGDLVLLAMGDDTLLRVAIGANGEGEVWCYDRRSGGGDMRLTFSLESPAGLTSSSTAGCVVRWTHARTTPDSR